MKFILLLLAFLFSPSVFASVTIKFHSLSVDQGLSHKSVRAINQDKLGYIWIGTEDGLTRFDGIHLKDYQANLTNSLSGNYFTGIAFDDAENLWLSTTENGLNQYLPASDTFDSLKKSNSNLSSNLINTLISDSDQTLWIGTEAGLDKFDIESNTFTNFTYEPLDQHSLPASDVIVLLSTNKNELWIGTGKGVAILNKDTHDITRIKFPTDTQPKIRALAKDKNGNVWIGTSQGLYYFDIKTRLIVEQELLNTSQYVLSLLIDNDDNLWVGSYNQGLYKITPNRDISQYVQDKGDDKSLGDMIVLSLYQDDSGVIWVGTYNSGIHWFDPSTLSLGAFDNSLSSVPCLPSNQIFAAYPLKDQQILLGSSKGLSLLNRKTNKCKNFSHSDSNTTSLSHDSVYSIFKDSRGSLWIGTARGLDLLDLHRNEFTHYGHQFENKTVSLIEQNEKGQLILGTNSGIYLSDIETKQFQQIDSVASLKDARIYNMDWDDSGNLWIGSDKGLLFINQSFEKLELLFKNPEDGFTSHVRSVSPINKQSILLTIDGRGIFEFNPKNKSISSVAKKFSINKQHAFAGFHRDHDGSIWLMTTNSGLYKFHPNKSGSTHYTYEDGLVSNYVTPRSSTNLLNGNVLFGSRDGFSSFFPKTIKHNIFPPKVIISNLFLHGNKIIPKVDYNGFSLKQPVYNTESLVLEHFNNSIGFEFTAFHYSSPEENNYAYKLEGINDHWINSNAGSNGVTFDDLSAGEYRLRVKSISKNDLWSEEKELKLTILPAPWLTWWAYSLYVITSLFVILYVVYKRTEILRKRAISLENTVKRRTQDLKKEKRKVETLLSHKNEEFANVSHEFRTPLTLILGPLAQLLESNSNPQELDRLNIIQRNGYRLLRMVDQLLNLETFRIKSTTQKVLISAGKNIKLVAEAFIDLAAQKNIEFTIVNIVDVNLEFTTDALEKILLNILSNAVKYTKSGGHISLETFRTNNNQLRILVKDTGIGIPLDQLDSVFERYNRVLDENSEQITGAGIGLALVKDLVETHKGCIELKSEPGKGTSIDIYLPIVGEVTDAQIKPYQNDEIIAMELMGLTGQQSADSNEIITNDEHRDDNLPRLLVIEDNHDMRKYIVDSMRKKYKIFTASDGEEGLKIAISEIPDLIISDIMMPKMDGYETTHQLRKNQLTNHIPIVLLTARGDRESRLKGWHEKADEYLTKPFDTEELRIRLINLLEIRNILKKSFAERAFKTIDISESALNQATLNVELNRNKQQESFIAKINRLLEESYTEPTTSASDISAKLAMSERQLYRKMKSILDMTPAEYLRRFRLEKSKRLLEQGKTAAYTASEVGFSSQSYFGKCFKAQFGRSPKNYITSVSNASELD